MRRRSILANSLIVRQMSAYSSTYGKFCETGPEWNFAFSLVMAALYASCQGEKCNLSAFTVYKPHNDRPSQPRQCNFGFGSRPLPPEPAACRGQRRPQLEARIQAGTGIADCDHPLAPTLFFLRSNLCRPDLHFSRLDEVMAWGVSAHRIHIRACYARDISYRLSPRYTVSHMKHG